MEHQFMDVYQLCSFVLMPLITNMTPSSPHRPDAAQVPFHGGLPANMPPHPMYMPMQMLWWQQMYARHYYMQ